MRGWRIIVGFALGLFLSLSLASSTPAQTSAIATVETAKQHYDDGEYSTALKLLNQAEEEFASQGYTIQQAQTQALIALAQEKLGNWQPAKEAIDRGMALIATKPNTKHKQQTTAQLNNALGHLYLRRGENQKAIAVWEQAETSYKSIGDSVGSNKLTVAKAEALKEIGFYRRACNTTLGLFQTGITSCENLTPGIVTELQPETSITQESLAVEAIASLADSLMLLGSLSEAQAAINNAQLWRSPHTDHNTEGKIALTQGNIAQAVANLARDRDIESLYLQEQRKAIDSYKVAVAFQTTASSVAEANLLNLYLNTGQWQEANKIAKNVNLDRSVRGYGELKTQLLLTRSLATLKERQQPVSWQEIIDSYKEIAQEAAVTENSRLRSLALGQLGELAYQQQLTQIDAEETLRKALQLAQTSQAPEIAYRWQWQLGKVYRDRGDIELAISAYEAAVANLQRLRGDLVALDREIQFSFRERVEPVYREYAELLLVAQAPEAVAQTSNLKQARDAIEALQIAQIDNYFKDACVAAQQRDVEEIAPDAAVVYTILLPDRESREVRLETILSLANGSFVHRETVVPQEKFQQTIQQLGNYLLQPDRRKDSQKLAQEVYGWLIQPLETSLATSETEVNTLVFVLDGVLQNLPMSVLYNGDRYLLQDYAIAVAPGLRLLKTKSNPEGVNALAGGISTSVKNFSALDNVPTELNSIDNRLESQILLNSDLTIENLIRLIESQPFSIVHLATHGQFSSDPEATFLQLWDRQLTLEELSLLLQRRNLNSEKPIELLVLSACETAKGDRRATLGLAGMSVRTGVSSTIATLWQVRDNSTAALMSRFYSYLSQNPQWSKAKALQQAQLDLWEISGRNWSVPLYWGAYVMVGNWQ